MREAMRSPNEGPTNYVACYGGSSDQSGALSSVNQHLGDAWFALGQAKTRIDAAFFIDSKIKYSRITDGLSKTVAVSECLVGRPELRDLGGSASAGYRLCIAGQAPRTFGAGPENGLGKFVRGGSWFYGAYTQYWGFSTMAPPNVPLVDGVECIVYTGQGGYSARSDHPGGVNAIHHDASARFYNDDIDEDVWRALGTINRGETL